MRMSAKRAKSSMEEEVLTNVRQDGEVRENPTELLPFKGTYFDPKHSAKDERFCQNIQDHTNLSRFISYLRVIEDYNRASDYATKSNIVYADDDMNSRSQVKTCIDRLGLSDRLVMFSDSQQVIDYYQERVNADS